MGVAFSLGSAREVLNQPLGHISTVRICSRIIRTKAGTAEKKTEKQTDHSCLGKQAHANEGNQEKKERK